MNSKALFVDTSGWCAVYDRSDQNHRQALAFWQKISATAGLLYTTDYVLDETFTLLRVRIGHHFAVKFGQYILDSKVVKIIPITEQRWYEAWQLFARFKDQDFSFTDCTSFVVMKEFKLQGVIGFDHHFRQMGFATLPLQPPES